MCPRGQGRCHTGVQRDHRVSSHRGIEIIQMLWRFALVFVLLCYPACLTFVILALSEPQVPSLLPVGRDSSHQYRCHVRSQAPGRPKDSRPAKAPGVIY